MTMWVFEMSSHKRCGSLDDARGVFDAVSDRDVVLWTTIITAYAKRGLVKNAVELFESMLDAKTYCKCRIGHGFWCGYGTAQRACQTR